MNLLFAINQAFSPLLKVCLTSIVRNGGAKHYDAYVLHSDLPAQTQADLQEMFSEKVCFRFIEVDERIFDGFPEFKRYPKQIYYRLAASHLLPREMGRILYLDVDTVVINSLEAMYAADFDGAWFMGCTNIKRLLTKVNQVRLGIESDTPYINSGVLLLDLPAMRDHLSLDAIRSYAMEKRERLLLPDQDILTALCGEHVRLMDHLKYNLSDRAISLYNADPTHESIDLDWVRKNAVIIHYYGRNKPWKEGYRGILDVFYHEAAIS